MLKYLKKFRKQIKIIILILGLFAAVNWVIGLYYVLSYEAPFQDFSSSQSSNNSGIFIVIFILIVLLALPLVLLEKEFKHQDLLDEMKNKR